MKKVSSFLLGIVLFISLLIPLTQSVFCVDLKIIGLALLGLISLVAIFHSKKIFLDRCDILIVFILVFLNIYFTFVELRGLIFFKMTYILMLSMLISKVILPNIAIKSYLQKVSNIYLIILIFLVAEYLMLVFFGDRPIVNLLMCNGEMTGVRGYIELYNMTKEILPYHITGLNSIILGPQTAPQLSIIIFIWFLYTYKLKGQIKNLIISYIALLMVFLSPTITTTFMLLITFLILYLIHLKNTLKKEINDFYIIYVVITVSALLLYLLYFLLTHKYNNLSLIYDNYFLKTIVGFGYFSLNEILFGVSLQRESELFSTTEIAFINQLLKYGVIGMSIFYGSILYYVLRAVQIRDSIALLPNLIIIGLFILGNTHYQVMFNLGAMELFSLHLAYIIFIGSNNKKNINSSIF